MFAQNMQIKFSVPEHGWMTTELNGIALDVSDVPCDSLAGLIIALSNIQRGRSTASVDWSLEPEYGAWIFRQQGALVEVFIRENSVSDSVLVAELPRTQFIRKMTNALERLEAVFQAMTDKDADITWSWPFPSLELSKLQRQTNGEQGAAGNPLPVE